MNKGSPRNCLIPAALLLTISVHAEAQMPEPDQADIAWITEGGFCETETVIALPDGSLLVSNVCGFAEPGTGYLSQLESNGEVIDWRVVDNLDSPLGMVFRFGQLYVIDNNQVKIFRWPGFVPVSTIALNTAVANDLAVGPDDSIYVTDTARGEVVVVGPDLEQDVFIEAARFPGANGIHIDGDNLYVGGTQLWHIDLNDLAVTMIGPDWLADIDGIEQEVDGTLQVTPVGGPLVRLTDPPQVLGGEGVGSANHGYSESLGLALIPTGFDHQVIAIRVDR